jgi:hypothetical protein
MFTNVNANIQKLKNERATLTQILQKTMEELQTKGTFHTLRNMIDSEIAKQAVLKNTIERYMLFNLM